MVSKAFFINKFIQNDKAESPIEILITILVTLILFTGFYFAMSPIVDAFVLIISKVPIQLAPNFQNDLMSLMMLNQIYYAIPAFTGAVLIVWGVKTAIKKHTYATQTQYDLEYGDF